MCAFSASGLSGGLRLAQSREPLIRDGNPCYSQISAPVVDPDEWHLHKSSKSMQAPSTPQRKIAAKRYDAALVSKDTKSGAISLQKRSMRRIYVFNVVRCVEDAPAMVVTHSRSTATEIVVPDIVWTQPHTTMMANIPEVRGVDHGRASPGTSPKP